MDPDEGMRNNLGPATLALCSPVKVGRLPVERREDPHRKIRPAAAVDKPEQRVEVELHVGREARGLRWLEAGVT